MLLWRREGLHHAVTQPTREVGHLADRLAAVGAARGRVGRGVEHQSDRPNGQRAVGASAVIAKSLIRRRGRSRSVPALCSETGNMLPFECNTLPFFVRTICPAPAILRGSAGASHASGFQVRCIVGPDFKPHPRVASAARNAASIAVLSKPRPAARAAIRVESRCHSAASKAGLRPDPPGGQAPWTLRA